MAYTVRGALRKAVKAAKEADRLRAEHEFHVALAETLATQLDRAAVHGPAGEVVRLVESLRKLVDTLPLIPAAPPTPAEEGGPDDPATGDPDPGSDPLDRELESIVGSGPAMGYAT